MWKGAELERAPAPLYLLGKRAGYTNAIPSPGKVKLPSAEAGCRRQRQDMSAGYDASLRTACARPREADAATRLTRHRTHRPHLTGIRLTATTHGRSHSTLNVDIRRIMIYYL